MNDGRRRLARICLLCGGLIAACGRVDAQQPTFADRAVQALTGRGVETRDGRLPVTRTPGVSMGADALRSQPQAAETLPSPVGGDFPPLPPPPDQPSVDVPPPLLEELWDHGGAQLYAPEGDRWNWPAPDSEGATAHYDLLRLPESWIEPKPITAWSEFLGADPIRAHRHKGLLGSPEYAWDRRFVGYGAYELFGFAVEQDDQQQVAVGQQLLADLDLRLSGTERFHVQFRPFGERNSGGSYYQFSDPDGYVDNSAAAPTRFWFEGELHSFWGPTKDPLASKYVNFVVGKFPFLLQNSLLLNDEILGVVVNTNNLYLGALSNLNVQWWAGLDDVETYENVGSKAYGVNVFADHRGDLVQMNYAYVDAEQGRAAHYAGVSGTKFLGPATLACRAMFKWGDRQGTGDGQLLTLESNFTRVFDHQPCGVERAIYFGNAFWASQGWNSISGGNLNRLRTAFEVDPLVRLAAGPGGQDVAGVAFGVLLQRCHQDESWTPEIACEFPGGQAVLGLGLRYFRKTGPRTFLEVLGLFNASADDQFDRRGVFVSHTWLL